LTSSRSTLSLALASAVFLSGAPLLAQAPNHTHYAKPPEGGDRSSPSGALAPRLQRLGSYTFPVTTKSKDTQLFINQGVNLSYGFNHAEAARAFAEAAQLDPDCAMAYWGHALVLGPNINAPMNPADESKAYELAQKAVMLKSKASPRERDYIDALAQRYSGKAEDRKARDRAYADAMRELAKKYPDDLDAAALFAESLMDLRPWNYWTRDGEPYPSTEEAVATINKVLARNPNHPGALHFAIHIWEPTRTPERAEEAADRLLPLMPAAGHMVHMPGHIFYRVGRYADAAKANQLAIAADEDYITQCRAQGIYPLGYYPHNIHFLWASAAMEGQSHVAIEAARKTAAANPIEAVQQFPFLQVFLVVPYHALVRFGKDEDILKEPPPAYDSSFTRGVWHYARGMAFTATGKLAEAQKELDALQEIMSDPALAATPASFSANTAAMILRIGPEVLAGSLAAKKRDYDTAVLHLDRAVRYNDALVYTEPPDWGVPPRHVLGAVLLEAGRASEAEVVYWEDLNYNRNNGWALFGLWQALKAQGKDNQAAAVEQRFQKAWLNADVKLTASRF
jgi:tetratricopeptide (TPR) repeat protein